jgi:hypothetical protein
MSTLRFRPAVVTAATLVLYCTIVWLFIEQTGEWGEVIRRWRMEYFDANGNPRGSMKFRGDEGAAFHYVALRYGILAYPAAVIAAFLLIRHGRRAPSSGVRVACWGGVALLIAILGRFVYLGVFTCVIDSL